MQITHRFISAKIEIFPVYEWSNNFRQRVDVFGRPRYCATLYPGIAFPLPSLSDEVIFQHREVHYERAALSIWAQTHIYPENLAVRSNLLKACDKPSPKTGKKILVAY